MATPQLSPGVLTREVDLTVGNTENVLDNIGAVTGPFPIGPVEDPTDVATEQELIAEFGNQVIIMDNMSTGLQHHRSFHTAAY